MKFALNADSTANHEGFADLRVLSLESRRSEAMARLIENHGGIPLMTPSMREVPLDHNDAAFSFAGDLLQGRFHVVIFLTGVGTRLLFQAVNTRISRAELVARLSRTTVVARGPKPTTVLREYGIPVQITVPEPNTWKDILTALEESEAEPLLQGRCVAVQEYGVSNAEFLNSLRQRGAEVVAVPLYRWELPQDTGPLEVAVQEIVAGRVDVLLLTSAIQFHHLMKIAGKLHRIRAGIGTPEAGNPS
jgi:uroporphyrinogen-III synthase